MTVHAPLRVAASVSAALNFLRPMEGRPVAYQYDPPPGVPVRTGVYEPRSVKVFDARSVAHDLSLDVEGFALARQPSGLADFADEQAIRDVYYPEVERIVAAETGAALTITFDHNVRDAARAAAGVPGIRGPVDRTHNDFTARSGRDRALRELAARGLDPALLDGRFAIVNLWRPIGRPVEKSPLALCDASTIAAEDLIVSDLVYRDRVGETYALQFNEEQDWFYFPRLTAAEAILIKSFDTAEDGVARFAAHSAFEDPATPADAPERASIETRVLAIFGDASDRR